MVARKRILPGLLLAMLGVVAGLVATAVAAAPRVIAFSPEAGSEHIPATTRLSIIFTRGMDPASVEEHLSIEPSAAGRWVWEGTTVSFEPAVPWPTGATVTAQLSAGARSSRLLPLLRSYTWAFTVVAHRLPYGQAAAGYLPADLDGQQTTPDGHPRWACTISPQPEPLAGSTGRAG
jgi:hypothetical protein